MINKINAIVTGGSSGLGEATARKILENNYSAKKWNFLCLAIWIEKNL